MPYLNLAAIRLCTESEGPGKRIAIWVQGCQRKCPGCCNQGMQEVRKNKIVDSEDFVSVIANAKDTYQIEGITMLGGEPILQAEGLSYIAEWCRNHDLSVIVFTGYLYQELLKINNPHVMKLLRFTDILVDGPYMEDLYDTERDWIGSSNQRVYFFTELYKSGIEYKHQSRSMEINISEKTMQMNGWPF